MSEVFFCIPCLLGFEVIDVENFFSDFDDCSGQWELLINQMVFQSTYYLSSVGVSRVVSRRRDNLFNDLNHYCKSLIFLKFFTLCRSLFMLILMNKSVKDLHLFRVCIKIFWNNPEIHFRSLFALSARCETEILGPITWEHPMYTNLGISRRWRRRKQATKGEI